MNEINLSSRRPDDRTIIYHFDVATHSLPLKQSVDTANATMAIVESFNEQLFDGKGKFELRVGPTESGGLISTLIVTVSIGVVVWKFLESEIGKAFIEGLTERKPAYWAKQLGKRARKTLHFYSHNDNEVLDATEILKALPEENEEIQRKSLELQAAVIAEVITRFMEAPTEALQTVGLDKGRFKKAYIGKNQIYQGCLDNREVKGLNFDRSMKFRLRRRDFVSLIEKLPNEWYDPERQLHWNVEITDVIVNSPNWQSDGRGWQGNTSEFQKITFSIHDQEFWHRLREGGIKTSIRDTICVQWAYLVKTSKPTNVRVLKVLSFNGRELAKPLSDLDLQYRLESFSPQKADIQDLFEYADEVESRPVEDIQKGAPPDQ